MDFDWQRASKGQFGSKKHVRGSNQRLGLEMTDEVTSFIARFIPESYASKQFSKIGISTPNSGCGILATLFYAGLNVLVHIRFSNLDFIHGFLRTRGCYRSSNFGFPRT